MRSGRNGAKQVKFSKYMQPPQTRPPPFRRPSFWEHTVLTGVFLASEWSTGMPDRVTQAVKKAQAILARYVEPRLQRRAAEGRRQGRQFGRRGSQRIGGVTEARGMLAIFGARPARFFMP